MTKLLILLLATAASAATPLQYPPNLPPIATHTDPTETYTPSKVSALTHRLDPSITPLTYTLDLTVSIDDKPNNPAGLEPFMVKGEAEIHFQVTEPTNRIVFHANRTSVHEITRGNVTVTDDGNGDIGVSTVVHLDDSTNFVTVGLATNLVAGRSYTLGISFVSIVSREVRNGLYSTSYVDENGGVNPVAATQMQPVHARQMFPCFDEPHLKAKFNVKVTHRSEYVAVSNGNGSSVDSPIAGWTTTTFAETVSMSTYLFALTIGKFHKTTATPVGDGSGPEVNVYSPPHLADQVTYSTQLTAELLSFFDETFNTTYPMSKLDSAAVDKGGAMENWGLVLYRSDLLYWKENVTLETARNSMVSVVSHELAHMNFGNWVTCSWWSHLWLNEGFASYLSYVGVDATTAPVDFKHTSGIVGSRQAAMVYDASPASHPMTQEPELVQDPEAVDRLFSTITYDKGASVIRMMEGVLGQQEFWGALREYLKEMQFQSTDEEKFFTAMETYIHNHSIPTELPENVTFGQAMRTWTRQTGFPILRVIEHDSGTIEISQENAENKAWFVPVGVARQRGDSDKEEGKPEFWLTPENLVHSVSHNVSEDGWIVVNPGGYAYHRTLYSSTLTTLIRDALESDKSQFSPTTRSTLIDDYFTLAFEGYVPIETALTLSHYMDEEDEQVVWEPFWRHLSKLLRFLDEDEFVVMQAYLSPKLSSALSRLSPNITIDGGSVEILRMKLLDWACALDHPEHCIEESLTYFDAWETNGPIPIPANSQAPLLCSLVGKSGKFDFIWGQYKTATDDALRGRFLSALACEKGENKIKEYLGHALGDGNFLNSVDALTWIQKVAMTNQGGEVVLEFLMERFDEFVGRFGGGAVKEVFKSMFVNGAAGGVGEGVIFEALKFKEQFADKLEDLEISISMEIEAIRDNAKWKAQWGLRMLEWMDKNRPVDGGDSSGGGRVATNIIFVSIVVAAVVGYFV